MFKQIEKGTPPRFCILCKADSSEMCFLSKECDSVQSQEDEKEGKSCSLRNNVSFVTALGLISHVQL